jgi:transposase
MRAYSMDLRERVLTDCDEGLGTAAVAAKYRVSPAWIRRLNQRRKATGETAPRPGGRRKTTWTPYAEAIRAAIAETPEATLAELRQRLALPFSIATLHRAIAALGYSVKKKSSGPPSGTGPTWPPSEPSGRRPSRPSTRPG